MFRYFSNVWTPVCEARLVHSRAPYKCRVADEDLTLFRNKAGTVVAMPDRCPHRGASLSGGTITKNGTIRCPYHGLEFGGAARHRLAVYEREPCRLAPTTFDVREIGGLVWIYTSATEAPKSEPHVPAWLTDPLWHKSFFTVTWRTHWTVALENLLDPLHTAFVHPTSVGIRDREILEKYGRLEIHVVDTETGCRLVSDAPGVAPSWEVFSEWVQPNSMVLHERGLRTATWCVPLDDQRTDIIFVAALASANLPHLRAIVRAAKSVIFPEDKRVLEAIAGEVLPVEQTSILPSDPAVERFRSYYHAVLRRDAHGRAVPSIKS